VAFLNVVAADIGGSLASPDGGVDSVARAGRLVVKFATRTQAENAPWDFMTELDYELFGLVTRPVPCDAVITSSAVIRSAALERASIQMVSLRDSGMTQPVIAESDGSVAHPRSQGGLRKGDRARDQQEHSLQSSCPAWLAPIDAASVHPKRENAAQNAFKKDFPNAVRKARRAAARRGRRLRIMFADKAVRGHSARLQLVRVKTSQEFGQDEGDCFGHLKRW
jgi:hypothetical protein